MYMMFVPGLVLLQLGSCTSICTHYMERCALSCVLAAVSCANVLV